MTTIKYKGFRIQDNNGLISIFWETPKAYTALSGGYGFNRKGITFRMGTVEDISAARKVIRTLYDNDDKFMKRQEAVTTNALKGGI